MLCSINDRLGGKVGNDFPSLSDDWMQDLYWLVLMDGEHERRRKENETKTLRRKLRSGKAFAFDEDDLEG